MTIIQVMFGILTVIISVTVFLSQGYIGSTLKHWLNLVGPTLFILFPMSVMLVYIVVLGVMRELKPDELTKKIVTFIEEGGPAFGLLGTVLSLSSGFSGLNLSSDVQTLMTEVVGFLKQGLNSTAVGLVIGLSGWVVHKFFFPQENYNNKRPLNKHIIKSKKS